MRVETMTVFARVYSGVHEHFPARRSEWVMAFAMIAWGCILAGPDDKLESHGQIILEGLGLGAWGLGLAACGLRLRI